MEGTAATAGSASTSNSAVDAPDSLCPYGWQLPAYANSGSFYQLVQLYLGRSGNKDGLTQADTALLMSPLSFLRSGDYSISGPLNDRGSYGHYWSRRSSSTAGQAYYLGFASTYVRPQRSLTRGTGRSVRCLAR